MKLPFGFEIVKAAPPAGLQQPTSYSRGREWWPVVRESFTGAWQRNTELRRESVLAHSAVYSCVTLIASDISKMRLRLVEQDSKGIWKETESAAFSPVLRKPNRYQNRIKFVEQWIVSKLIAGNTYVLLQRDSRNVVEAMYILDPTRTKPLVAPDGSVFYSLTRDNLSGLEEAVIVPASEIIHDTMVPLFHPLCGVSPIFACGLAALQGLSIQANSTKFFERSSMPGGILTAPGVINDVTAARLKQHWEDNYTGGEAAGKVAVLGDGLKFEKLALTAVEAQVIDQLKWTSETVCSCFHVPPYMIGAGPAPSYNNVEALNQQYYSQCLQAPIESVELCLDEGLGLTAKIGGRTLGTEFDLDDLLRMDSATQIDALAKAVGGSIMTPNSALKKLNMSPVEGGDTIYMQQQNYSLEALSKRDAQEDPFGTAAPPPSFEEEPEEEPEDEEIDQAAKNQVAMWSLKDALEGELANFIPKATS